MLSVPAHPPRFRAWSSFSRDRDVALTRLPLCSLMNRLYYQPTRPSLLFDVSAGSATVHSQHTNTQTFIHNTPIRKRCNGHTKDKTFTPRTHHGHEPPDHPNPPTHPHDLATTESAAGSTAAASPGAERSPRPTQKRPPPANPTRPPPPPRAPPRACSKAVGEIKREQQTRRVRRCGRPCTSRKCVPAPPGRCLFTGTYIMLAPEHC